MSSNAKLRDFIHTNHYVLCMMCEAEPKYDANQHAIASVVKSLYDDGWRVSPSGFGLRCPKCMKAVETTPVEAQP